MAEVADKVARSIALSWAVVEKDDVKQHILMNSYERRKDLEKHWGDEAFVYAFCKKLGNQYASAERDARDVEDGQYYYTPLEARQALETFVYSDDEMGQLLGREDDLLRTRITDSLMTARMDASMALNRLPKASQAVLMKRYVYGLPAADDAERKAANRAVDNLARQMNRDLRKMNA
jgi:DNA-directed RNA polymerase specialized sigma24 family protein